MPKKGPIFFYQISKFDALHFICQGLFKNIVFRYVAVVMKKLWDILDFFTQT